LNKHIAVNKNKHSMAPGKLKKKEYKIALEKWDKIAKKILSVNSSTSKPVPPNRIAGKGKHK